ncbi:MAG: hypothetical protein OXH86_12275 [Acidimicrobiaceae bacterium]|nr:hypothetical protein [Acidimicrobiaceae bacterium]MDE0320259.1 hypothetical protein [Acidimicrobiaceae bacterium]MDE0498117.1 hypothetical protein [Acidimicrobiaceae bacterium]
MRWFEAARDRRRGRVAVQLQNKVAQNLDVHVEELLAAAVHKWRRDGWHRFGKHTGNWTEDDCTVQMYRWSKECTRRESRFALLTVHWEWRNLTPAILHGHQSAATATRPDLRIEVREEGRSIECKRIASGGSWARKYVHAGLDRFVTGDYGHAESSGFMVGYAVDEPLPPLVGRINGCIQSHPNMGAGHVVAQRQHSPPILLGDSSHTRSGSHSVSSDIGISHLLVALDT